MRPEPSPSAGARSAGRGQATVGVVLAACAVLLISACSSSSKSAAPPSTVASTPTTAHGAAASTTTVTATKGTTVWVCRPGLANNPCNGDQTATVVKSDGTSTPGPTTKPAASPPIDCFYVYPTVSEQKTPNATLTVDAQVRGVTIQQAARFSSVCRVYAPVYPQLTLAAITGSTGIQAAAAKKAYAGVVSAWDDYLAHDNQGRGVVLIGHSQGAGMLTQLIHDKIDGNPVARKRLVSAILLGGNVVVPAGKDVGGVFVNVPACRSDSQLHCVIAYSTFNEQPPANALFGRASGRFTTVFGGRTVATPQILCTNPAALSGGKAALHSYFATEPLPGVLGTLAKAQFDNKAPTATTPWVELDGHYEAECANQGGASVLMISPVGSAVPLKPEPDASWGLHLVDVNIALGDLVDDVKAQSQAYAG
jgi:hypothetical protein